MKIIDQVLYLTRPILRFIRLLHKDSKNLFTRYFMITHWRLKNARVRAIHARAYAIHTREYAIHARACAIHARAYVIHAREYVIHARAYAIHARASGARVVRSECVRALVNPKVFVKTVSENSSSSTAVDRSSINHPSCSFLSLSRARPTSAGARPPLAYQTRAIIRPACAPVKHARAITR